MDDEEMAKESVPNDCVLSREEIDYLRSLHCTDDVQGQVDLLQEDIYCANKARTKEIYTGLGLLPNDTNDAIISRYGDAFPDHEVARQLFDTVDSDGLFDKADKAFLKAILVVRALFGDDQPQEGDVCDISICSIPLTDTTGADLKESICSLAFRKRLWQFQEDTSSGSDCLIGPKTLFALTTKAGDGKTNEKQENEKQKGDPLVQHFSVPGFQEYVEARTKEKGTQEYLCSGYTNGELTGILHAQNKTFRFPVERSAWGKDADLPEPFFTKTPLAGLGEHAIIEKLNACVPGTTLTVQNSKSDYIEYGVTHTLIYLGGGKWSEQVGAKTNEIVDIALLVTRDPDTGDVAIKKKDSNSYYRFVAGEEGKTGSALYEPNLDKMPSVTFKTLNKDEFDEIKKDCGRNSVLIAKYLAKTYGGSYSYYGSIFGSAVRDNETVQVPIVDEEKNVDHKKTPPPTDDALVYQGILSPEKSPLKNSKQVVKNATGVDISPYGGLLGAIYDNERNGGGGKSTGRKRKAAEQYLSSFLYRAGNKNPLNIPINRALRRTGHGDVASGKKEITSLGPFQIKIDVYKNLVKIPKIVKNIQKILKKEFPGFEEKNLASLSYDDNRTVLYCGPVALYLAYEICKQNVGIVHTNAESAGIAVQSSDTFLTAQLMYNIGAPATYGAVLQQELYKIAKEHNCSPPEKFVFDGADGPQTQALLRSVRSVIGSNVSLQTKANGRITHLVVAGNRIAVQDIGGLHTFFSGAGGGMPKDHAHDYYPALDFSFLQTLSQQTGNAVRPHYVGNTLKNAYIKKGKPAPSPDKVEPSDIAEASCSDELDALSAQIVKPNETSKKLAT